MPLSLKGEAKSDALHRSFYALCAIINLFFFKEKIVTQTQGILIINTFPIRATVLKPQS